MSETERERIEGEYLQAASDVTAADLTTLVPHIERFGLGGELDAVVRTARPNAKVQRRFLPAHVQGDILKAAMRTPKALELVQDAVVGLYADEIGDDVMKPSLEQLAATTEVVLGQVSPTLVKLTLLGVVLRDEVAAPQAIAVLRERLDCAF